MTNDQWKMTKDEALRAVVTREARSLVIGHYPLVISP
jgi:hypothetical protein